MAPLGERKDLQKDSGRRTKKREKKRKEKRKKKKEGKEGKSGSKERKKEGKQYAGASVCTAERKAYCPWPSQWHVGIRAIPR